MNKKDVIAVATAAGVSNLNEMNFDVVSAAFKSMYLSRAHKEADAASAPIDRDKIITIIKNHGKINEGVLINRVARKRPDDCRKLIDRLLEENIISCEVSTQKMNGKSFRIFSVADHGTSLDISGLPPWIAK